MTATARGLCVLSGKGHLLLPTHPESRFGGDTLRERTDDNAEEDKKATMDASSAFVSSCKLCCLLDWWVTAALGPQLPYL